MTNGEVIDKFLQHREGHTPTRNITNGYQGNTLTTDGQALINYKTTIAYFKGGKLYLNKTKYSTTTSKIQTQLENKAENYINANDIVYYKV